MTPKQELIKKLYDEEHISFDEMLILLEENTTEQHYPIYPIPFPIYPLNPNPYWEIPFENPFYKVTC